MELPPIETHPWRLGYYKNCTWEDFAKGYLNEENGYGYGIRDKNWEWTDFCCGNIAISNEDAVENGVPLNIVWAVLKRDEDTECFERNSSSINSLSI